MLEARKILTATIGYIIGIIMGLYCKISIVLFYVLIYLISKLVSRDRTNKKFKLISFKRYFRYVKIIFNKKVIKIIIIFSMISNSIILFQNYKYNNLYKNLDNKEITILGTVSLKSKEQYKIKIKYVNKNTKYKETYLYLNTKVNLQKGDNIILKGIFYLPSTRSNYKGFDYSNYLKTLEIYGTVKSDNINVISKNNVNIIFKITNKLTTIFKDRIKQNMPNNQQAIIEGILLGNKEDIDEQIINNFSESNISYILAISGMHITYIISISNLIFVKLAGKHYSKILTSIVLIIYMSITNFTASVVRAGITGILMLIANFVYRKNDTYNSLALALLVILIYNPYLIQSISLQLSFAGTIGIIIISKTLKKIIDLHFKRIEKNAIRRNKRKTSFFIKIRNSKVFQILEESTIITISASIVVFPIVLINFHKISITSLLISVITSLIIGPIVILGILLVCLKSRVIALVLSKLVSILIFISEIGSKLPLNQIYFITPNLVQIIFYYSLVFIVNSVIKIYINKRPSLTQKRIKNLISLLKFKIITNKKKIISIILSIGIIFTILKIVPKNLKIYFIDVGQGDSTLIITPKGKKILVDGGGSLNQEFNIRKASVNAIFIKSKNYYN